ncbi:hypothetical protein CIK05_05600 [Bdellovibrio sp. qaytius]|nr:hypothetical protein CIK05_05600 [Bdellovibrio sp. qaytius]
MFDLLKLTCIAVGFSVFLQNLELWSIRSHIGPVWKLPKFFPPEQIMIALGLVCSVGLCVDLRFAIPLLILALIWSVVFRGSFNGGSDFMTVTLLIGLSLSLWNPQFGLSYVGVQSLLSYLISGRAKLKDPDWRKGKFLPYILQGKSYEIPNFFKTFTAQPKLLTTLSLGVIFFEISFPVVLISPRVALLYFAVGIVFHFLNFMVLGLNRFFFIWLATYPTIYFLQQQLG